MGQRQSKLCFSGYGLGLNACNEISAGCGISYRCVGHGGGNKMFLRVTVKVVSGERYRIMQINFLSHPWMAA